nr:site-specific integrase [Aeoliella straminimaris]
MTVARVCDDFLDFCQRQRSKSTYDWYANYLRNLVAFVGPRLKVEDLTPRTVGDWVDRSYGELSDSAQHAAARCVTRAMNWAVKERMIRESPLVGYTKPSPSSREIAVTPAQYKECLEHARGPFRDLLIFLWETGCRPLEARTIEARWIDGPKVVLPTMKSKGKKKRRVIYMNETAAEIAARLAGENPTGPIFRSSKGNPWTKSSINCAFKRLKKKTGMDWLCAYALRHGFATESLKRGVDTTTVGVLMGHANPNMVARVYQHLAQDDDYLLGVLKQPHDGTLGGPDSPQAAAG